MSNRKFGEDAFAVTMWKPEDIITLRPTWSYEKAVEWLSENEHYISDRLIELGWDVIETLLPPQEKGVEE